MIEFNEEIMEKVKQVEKRREYHRRCLAAHICPKCGHRLSEYEDHFGPSSDFECTKCDFKTEDIVL